MRRWTFFVYGVFCHLLLPTARTDVPPGIACDGRFAADGTAGLIGQCIGRRLDQFLTSSI